MFPVANSAMLHLTWMLSSFLLYHLQELHAFKTKIHLCFISKMQLFLLPYLLTSASTLSQGCGNTFLNSVLNFQ
jgi:hypothetical protein